MSLSPLLRALLLSSWVLGCSEQGEGERCDTNNGNYDCEPGLLCKSGAQLDVEGRGVALCCPPDEITPSVDACRAGTQLPPDPDLVTDAGDGGS
jgi:hypothetical protein